MTNKKVKSGTIDVKALLAGDEEFLRALVRTALEEGLEAEMTEALGAEKGERTARRLGYRSGYYGRTLITRIGKLELRVPQDRAGRFSTELFERYQRSERALVAALAEMYVQGVSTRKVKAITEELCGHSFSASAISAINQRLDSSLAQFADRPLAEAFPYLILDARYERVREAGVIVSQAVLIAIGIDWDGRRQVLAVELANRESRSSWRDFLLGLKVRGLHGVEFVVADDHAGLRAALTLAGFFDGSMTRRALRSSAIRRDLPWTSRISIMVMPFCNGLTSGTAESTGSLFRARASKLTWSRESRKATVGSKLMREIETWTATAFAPPLLGTS